MTARCRELTHLSPGGRPFRCGALGQPCGSRSAGRGVSRAELLLLPGESVLTAPALVWVIEVIEHRERRPVLFELELALAAVGEAEDYPGGVLGSKRPTCQVPLPET